MIVQRRNVNLCCRGNVSRAKRLHSPFGDQTRRHADELPPPFLCPTAWSCADIGGALPPGQDALSNGTWTETAGGGDIWGTADSFHFVSQALGADGIVTARVTAQQNTDPWAKTGVMLRQSADPGSAFYALYVTPSGQLDPRIVVPMPAKSVYSRPIATPGSAAPQPMPVRGNWTSRTPYQMSGVAPCM